MVVLPNELSELFLVSGTIVEVVKGLFGLLLLAGEGLLLRNVF